jgi:phosphate:Na+ symporter
VLYQIVLKSLGVAVSLLLYASDRLLGLHAVVGVLDAAGLSPAARLAAVYVALQLASELAMQLFRRPVLAYLERLAPPSHEEVLGRPHYLRDGVLAESESALLLVDKEQQRLLRSLESYLAPLRAEARSDEVTVAVRHAAERQVLRECDHFLTEVADRNHSRQTLERTIVLRDRNELLDSLQDTLAEMVRAVEGPGADAAVRQHIDGLVEGLHMMLETLADVAEQPTDDDLALVRTLTHDRSELMDGIRRRLQGGAVAPDVQQAVFTVTALFERSMWLLRRYALLLDVAGSEMA